MTRQELLKRLPNASESFLKANAQSDPVVGLDASKRKQDPVAALDRHAPAQPRRRGRVVVCVTIIAFRHRLLDDDNNSASVKHLRDLVSRSLDTDDGSECIRWEYGQHQTTGAEGTLVRICWI